MSEKPERQRIVEEAIEWMVRLQSGDFSAAEGDALERWKALSSEHAEVFRQLLGSLAPLQDSPWRGQPSATVLRALEQPSSRRRFVGGALGLFVLLAGGAGLERWVQAGMGLPGELATGTGERRDWLLADGSRLRLNARSKARPLLDGAQRRLELRRGAMRLEVKEDPRGAFALDCAAGRVDCASGSLLLAEERGAIRLVTLRGSARLTTGEGRQLAVAARRSLLFDAGGLLEQGPMQAGEDAWASGWLEVHDRSLAWVAEALPALSARHPPARRGDRRQPRQRSVPAGRHAHVPGHARTQPADPRAALQRLLDQPAPRLTHSSKNSRQRSSILCRGGASAGVQGSSKAVCAPRRACASSRES